MARETERPMAQPVYNYVSSRSLPRTPHSVLRAVTMLVCTDEA